MCRFVHTLAKFDTASFTGACLVEYACLKACAAANLTVPSVKLAPDLTGLRDQCAQVARNSPSETLDSCLSCPERNALARALRIIEKAAIGQMRGRVRRAEGRQRSGARRTDRNPGQA